MLPLPGGDFSFLQGLPCIQAIGFDLNDMLYHHLHFILGYVVIYF